MNALRVLRHRDLLPVVSRFAEGPAAESPGIKEVPPFSTAHEIEVRLVHGGADRGVKQIGMRYGVTRDFFPVAIARNAYSSRIDQPSLVELADHRFERRRRRRPVEQLLLKTPWVHVANHSHVEAKHRKSLSRIHLDRILVAGGTAQKKVAAPVGGNDERISRPGSVAKRLYKISVP